MNGLSTTSAPKEPISMFFPVSVSGRAVLTPGDGIVDTRPQLQGRYAG